MAKSRTYQEVLPYLHFEDGAYIYKDGRVCCGLRVVPYEYERFTAREIEELNLRVNRVFNDLPDYANLQMLRWHYNDASDLVVQGEGIFNQAFAELAGRGCLRTGLWVFVEFCPKKYQRAGVLSTLFGKAGVDIETKAFADVERLRAECKAAENDLLQ